MSLVKVTSPGEAPDCARGLTAVRRLAMAINNKAPRSLASMATPSLDPIWGGPFRAADYATICGIGTPYTSVSRMSRPLKRYVSFL